VSITRPPGTVRDELESTGEIPQSDVRVSADGRVRPASQPPRPDPEPTEFFADDQEAADCFAMADLSADEFESVLADARAQGDLSRENVAQLCQNRKPPATQQKPRRGPITDEFGRAIRDLEKAANRVVRLAGDDRFARNRDEIRLRNLGTLIRIVNHLDDDVIVALSGGFRRGEELDDPEFVRSLVRGDAR
jgi:hypothetical protein